MILGFGSDRDISTLFLYYICKKILMESKGKDGTKVLGYWNIKWCYNIIADEPS